MRRVIVVGGGPAGMMAAITAAGSGALVTLLESMERTGKKLLLTGNGRCNLTHMDEHPEDSCFGAEREFLSSILQQLTPEDVRHFFEELGVLTTERGGYVYPLTGQSSSVHTALLTELHRLKVRIKCSEKIVSIEKKENVWIAHTQSWQYEGDALILACGSMAAPKTGSDGSGYALAKMAGHTVIPVYPALTPVICKESYLAGAAGVRSRATVTLYEKKADDDDVMVPERDRDTSVALYQKGADTASIVPGRNSDATVRLYEKGVDTASIVSGQSSDAIVKPYEKGVDTAAIVPGQNTDRILGCESGELQWTNYGVSGIVIFQLSRQISACKNPDQRLYLEINLLPDQDEEALTALLLHRAAQLPAEKVSVLLEGFLHEKLVPIILQLSGISRKTCCDRLKEEEIRRLLHTAGHLHLTPTGTKSFDVCQVCRGGVDTSQVKVGTLESALTDGLYFAGELLDVDGLCGGYNLQWAWASGYTAGRAAASEHL